MMQNSMTYKYLRYERYCNTNAKCTSFLVCRVQRTRCLRGRKLPTGPRLVSCHADEAHGTHDMGKEDHEAQGGPNGDIYSGASPNSAFISSQKSDCNPAASSSPIHSVPALVGISAEVNDGQQTGSASANLRVHYSHDSLDLTGWYGFHLFDVLQGVHIDAQSASHLFSRLSTHNIFEDGPLTLDELLQSVRIAGITGFTLPSVIAAQLHDLVLSSGPIPSRSAADSLLASYAYDLAGLLDMLHGMEIIPSATWTDHALRVWVEVGGAGGDGKLNAAQVRSVMALLEVIYLPGAEHSAEPLTRLPKPLRPLLSPTQRASTGLGDPRSISPQNSERDPTPYLSSGAAGAASAAVSGNVRMWLDICLSALLDRGALSHSNQREDLYNMLPHLVVAPSAGIVERLYSEAWPPHVVPAATASPEHIASMLWLIAASGAKLPPAMIQRELRALEAAVLHAASSANGNGQNSSGANGNRPFNGLPGGTGASPATAAAAAALTAAFLLPSSPGASNSGASSPHPSSPPSSFAATAVPIPPSAASSHRFSNGEPPISPMSPGSSNSPGISPFFAYLALWAFHHYRYIPHTATARIIGPLLLASAVSAGGRGLSRGLGPRQRCRIVRAVLMCFGSVPPPLLAKVDWAPLFRGWETLGATELLSLLQDVTTLARQRRRLRSHNSRSGAESDVQLLRLSHLAAHVIQLSGWERRLEGVSLSDAAASLAGLLAILSDEVDSTGVGDAASMALESGTSSGSEFPEVQKGDKDYDGTATTAAGTYSPIYSSDDGRGDGISTKAILASPFAQQLLSGWLSLLIAPIQDGVKRLTEDWGISGRASGRSGSGRASIVADQAADVHERQDSYQQLPVHPSSGHGTQGMSGTGASYMALERPLHSVAGVADAAGFDLRQHNNNNNNNSNDNAAWRSKSWLPSPHEALAPSTELKLTAGELTAVLGMLSDTAAALGARDHSGLHRTLMWAMQRLGSRAGRCTVEPEAFAYVPDMLVQVDAMGWVDMPTEWAHAVIGHPDAEASWFRTLSWPQVLRTVLVSGHLVQRARAEVLRRHGSLTNIHELQQIQHHQHSQRPSSNKTEMAMAMSHMDFRHELGTDAGSESVTDIERWPSKAAALLTAAQQLRSHLLGLLSSRLATCAVTELRQFSLIWHTRDMPYDKEALEVALAALASALKAESGGDAAVVNRESVRDAAARLEMMCEDQEVAREEVERLFAPLRASGL